MIDIVIRNEIKDDHREVEELTREAFWNLHSPGCDEHYLVHILHEHEDYIPELDLVAELDGKIIGNVIYSKAKLIDEQENEKQILTFGPLSVLPEYQRQGIGKALLIQSFQKAVEMGYDTIVIFGNPGNYVSRGFISSKKVNVCLGGDIFPMAMMVKELKKSALDGRKWFYYESPAYEFSAEAAEEYDKLFAPKKKEHRASQEEFYMYSHARIID
ncbi:MAG: N-acetyltransferase [bacterium]|nr:N-acetyltransferase [bacterium]